MTTPTKPPSETTVAVIGLGPLGLIGLKTFLENGFQATGFESRSYIGGLWKDSQDASVSVHATTVFNSSKYRLAMSDFPVPEDVDDFPTATQLHQYFVDYARHFELDEHINLNTKVVHVNWDDARRQWNIETQHTESETISSHWFDKVCVATGTFVTPRHPTIPDIEKFAGKVQHSINFHGPEPFEDQNVLLIGMHATSQDVTNSLATTAKHVYMSHRSGLIMMPRYLPDGHTYDQASGWGFFFGMCFLATWFPRFWTWMFDKLVTSMSKKAFSLVADGPDSRATQWSIWPAKSLAVSTPLVVSSDFYKLLDINFAEPVAVVEKVIGPKSVQLKDGRVLEDIDSIIYCTGYNFDLPADMLPQLADTTITHRSDAWYTPLETYNPYPLGRNTTNNPPRLYLNIFPLHPNPAIRNSLVFLGQSGVPSPGFLQYEWYAWSISAIWRGKKHLPSLEEMFRWLKGRDEWRDTLQHLYSPNDNSTFYPIFMPIEDVFKWADSTAGLGMRELFSFDCENWYGVPLALLRLLLIPILGVGWYSAASWKLWWKDPELWRLVRNGVQSPTHCRLFGTEDGRKKMDWEEAKKRLRWENRVAEAAAARRLKSVNDTLKTENREMNGSVHGNGTVKKTN